jgi:PD-(D/E)XK nuclease superfamily
MQMDGRDAWLPAPVTDRIIGCAFRIANALSRGFVEKVYQNALAREMRKCGLSVVHLPRCRNDLRATGKAPWQVHVPADQFRPAQSRNPSRHSPILIARTIPFIPDIPFIRLQKMNLYQPALTWIDCRCQPRHARTSSGHRLHLGKWLFIKYLIWHGWPDRSPAMTTL